MCGILEKKKMRISKHLQIIIHNHDIYIIKILFSIERLESRHRMDCSDHAGKEEAERSKQILETQQHIRNSEWTSFFL